MVMDVVPSKGAPKGLRSLQAGRGLAAIAVAAFHMSIIIPSKTSVLSRLSQHGNAGVDFFFILSGFIIFYAHRDDLGHPERLLEYLRKRIVRVYPVYWFYTVIAMVIAIGFVGSNHIALPSSIADWITTFSLVRITDSPMPLNAAWTLFYEIAFYGLFASLILNRRVGIAVFAIWALALIVLNRSTPINDVTGVWTSRLCLNFIFGMIACWIHARIGWRAAACLVAAGVVSLGFAAVYADHGLGANFGSLLALSFTCIVAGVAAIERRIPLHFGVLSALGDASYTTYLAHGHLEPLLMHLLDRTHLSIAPDVSFVVVLTLTVALTFVLYMMVEKPIVTLLRRAK